MKGKTMTENDSAWLRERAHGLMMEQHAERQRPSVVYRPTLRVDGDRWIALYGDDLATGVVGCGKTPAEAMADFDEAWTRRESDVSAAEDTRLKRERDELRAELEAAEAVHDDNEAATVQEHAQYDRLRARCEALETALRAIVAISEDREAFVRDGPRGWMRAERIAKAALLTPTGDTDE